MPYTPLKIAIPDPCQEDWQNMQPVSGTTARHCASCTKNVVDFTGFTDAQLHAYVRENKGKLCGRFRPDQLERPLRAAGAPTRHPLKVAAAAAGLMLATTSCETPRDSPRTMIEKLEIPEAVLGGMEVDIPATGYLQVEAVVPPPPPLVGRMLTDELSPNWEDTIISPRIVAPTETIEGELVVEPVSEVPKLNCGTSQLQEVDTEEVIVGAIDLISEVPDLEVIDTIPLPPPPPPPPIEPPMVMGFVTAAPPKPTGIDWVKDSLRNLLPTLPSTSSTQHLRARPEEKLPVASPKPTIYPNPFVDHFKIDLETPEAVTLHVALFDENGRQVHQETWHTKPGSNTLKVTPRRRKLKHQRYFLRISDGKAFSATQVLVR
ncbi:MAG: T9SS type A sorting domain-containing protein [Bacteroidota bacterium]